MTGRLREPGGRATGKEAASPSRTVSPCGWCAGGAVPVWS